MVACVDLDEDSDLDRCDFERLLEFGEGIEVVNDYVDRAWTELLCQVDKAGNCRLSDRNTIQDLCLPSVYRVICFEVNYGRLLSFLSSGIPQRRAKGFRPRLPCSQ